MDPNSFANIPYVLQSHVDFVLEADFDAKVLSGSVTITAKVVKTTKTFVLDTRDLTITSATLIVPEEKALSFTLAEPHKAFGAALTIDLGSEIEAGTQLKVKIAYSTSPDASAIQWLEPSQTAEKTHPYLFTQCQAIHARSMYPTQDSCAAKITYTGKVTVPTGLTALMSATRDGDDGDVDGKTTFKFKQPVNMAPYLVALAIGKLSSKEIGPRSKVWCEASMLEAAAYEFGSTEIYLKTAEEILGPYEWGTYDILMLPPSFPYGGMENPQLTFATPTLLAGDRSNANVVAHEIVHSWCGNLVTNKYWTDFWLNEGFTVFNERKIVARVHGQEEADLHSLLGHNALQSTVELFGESNQLTNLVTNLDGIDPDDAFSRVPYEKGYHFLLYLEKLAGGPTKFEPFQREWIQKNKFQTVTSYDFRDFYVANFPSVEVDWEKWLKTPGMPIESFQFDDKLASAYVALAKKWRETGGVDASLKDIEGWPAKQVEGMVLTLLSGEALSSEVLERLGSVYNIASSKNSEIRFAWYKLGIAAEYAPILQPACDFLLEQGRMKFVRPLYRALHASKMGKEKAIELFKANKEIYHGICRAMVTKDLGLA